MGQFGQNRFEEFVSNWKASRVFDKKQRDSNTPSRIQAASWVWGIRFALIAALFFLPWQNGCLAWGMQWWLIQMGLGLGLLLPAILYLGIRKSDHLRIPGMSLILGVIAIICMVQTLPMVPKGWSWTPNSVRAQEWFQGDPVELRSGLLSSATLQSIGDTPPASESSVSGWMSISMCKDDTLAALGAIALSALCIWLGSVLFAEQRAQSLLLHGITFCGLMVTAVLFMETISWQSPEWATLDQRRLVGTFTNKNAAGAFLSICLTASIGLTATSLRTLRHEKSKQRYRYNVDSVSVAARYLKQTFDFLSGIQTLHVAYLLTTILLFAAVVATMSRGAGVACAVATIVLIFAGSGKRTWNLPVALSLAFLIFIAIGVLSFLDLDREVLTRYDQLMEGETLEDRGRLYIFAVSLRAFSYYLFTGCGFACYGYGTLPFFEDSGISWHRYSESIWGNLIVELGFLGVILLGCVIWELRKVLALSFQAARHHRNYFMPFTGIFGLTYTLIHSAVDFRLIVPAVFIPSSLLLGALYGCFYSASGSAFRIHKDPSEEDSDESDEESAEENESAEQELLLALQKVKSKRIEKQKPREANQKTPLPLFGWTRWPSQSIAGVAFLLLILASLMFARGPIHRGAFAEQLESWAAEHGSKIPLNELADNLEKWNDLPDSQWNVHSLRILGELKIEYWQRRYEHLVQEVDKKTISDAESNPFANRLVLLFLNPAVEKQLNRYGGKSLFDPMLEASKTFEKAIHHAPLEWRSELGRALWDIEALPAVTMERLRRLRPLVQHRPADLVEAGVLAELLGDRRLAVHCFADATQLSGSVSDRILKFLVPRLQEEPLSELVLPNDVHALRRFIDSKDFSTMTPGNRQVVWERTQKVLEKPMGVSADRYYLTYELAARRDDLAEKKKCLDRWERDFPNDPDLKARKNAASK